MLTIRPATAKDAALIVEFIRELAAYERAPEEAIVSKEDILRDGFPAPGAAPKFWCLIAEWDGEPAGFALYFFNYSTWLGRWGLYLEDLFVRPDARGKGVGKGLLRELAHIAVKKQATVLDWNQSAIDFYESLGAELQKDWLTVRLMGEPMKKLAEEK